MPSRQEKLAYYKTLRAEAHRTCDTFGKTYGRVALGFPLSIDADFGMSGKSKTKYKDERRNPGKNDGYTYKSDAYLPPKDTIGQDQYDEDIYYEYDYMGRYLEGELDYYDGELPIGADGAWKNRGAISLLDLAKPAKPRGVAKNFTVVPNVPRVLAIDDFPTDQESWKDEDYDAWVDVPNFNRKSYASAVSKG